MNMPCRDAPEAWVGDDAQLRAQAVIDCMSCDFLNSCRTDAEANQPEFGVQAGVDYTPQRRDQKRKNARTKVCGVCGAGFAMNAKESLTQWGARKTCSRSCGASAGNRKKAA